MRSICCNLQHNTSIALPCCCRVESQTFAEKKNVMALSGEKRNFSFHTHTQSQCILRTCRYFFLFFSQLTAYCNLNVKEKQTQMVGRNEDTQRSTTAKQHAVAQMCVVSYLIQSPVRTTGAADARRKVCYHPVSYHGGDERVAVQR